MQVGQGTFTYPCEPLKGEESFDCTKEAVECCGGYFYNGYR